LRRQCHPECGGRAQRTAWAGPELMWSKDCPDHNRKAACHVGFVESIEQH